MRELSQWLAADGAPPPAEPASERRLRIGRVRYQASAALKISDASLSDGHYGELLKKAGRNDLVYLDPPYSPISGTSRFTEYTNRGFDDDDQRGHARMPADHEPNTRRLHATHWTQARR